MRGPPSADPRRIPRQGGPACSGARGSSQTFGRPGRPSLLVSLTSAAAVALAVFVVACNPADPAGTPPAAPSPPRAPVGITAAEAKARYAAVLLEGVPHVR